MELREQNSHRWAKAKAVLDVLTSLVLVAAAGLLVWRAYPASERRIGSPPKLSINAPQELGDAPIKGDPSARVAVIVYSDFQCPFCSRFALDVLPRLTTKYLDSGQVLLTFRHMPLQAIHPLAMRAADASVCAYRQGKFWAAHDKLFEIQGRLTVPGIAQAMTAAAVDLPAWNRCMEAGPSSVVSGDLEAGIQLGITGTPYFLIGTVRDKKVTVVEVINGAQPVPRFAAALDRVIALANQ